MLSFGLLKSQKEDKLCLITNIIFAYITFYAHFTFDSTVGRQLYEQTGTVNFWTREEFI